MTDLRPRVLVVEDHPQMRNRIITMMSDSTHVVGAVADGREAVRAVAVSNPDVVLLDVSLPGRSGFEVARELRRRGSTVPIVFLSAYEEAGLEQAAAAAGGNAYVVKFRMGDAVQVVLNLTERTRQAFERFDRPPVRDAGFSRAYPCAAGGKR
jgi:CheY-like chemotaxis protein